PAMNNFGDGIRERLPGCARPGRLSQALLEWKSIQEGSKGRRIMAPGGIAFAGSQFVFAGYSGVPFSNRAFNLRLRSACRALGVATRFAGNPGVPPPQEYSHDSPLHPCRLRTNTADCGGTQPGVGVKYGMLSSGVLLTGEMRRAVR